MMLVTHFQTAIKQLLANKGKAALTMLGVVIGIGSVIYIMTLGEVAKKFLLDQISQFGTNVIEVAVAGEFGPFGGSEDVTLTVSDVDELKSSTLLPELTKISAGYSVTKNIEIDGKKFTTSILGDTIDVFELNHLNLMGGRFYTESEEKNAERVVVIGDVFAEDQFGSIKDAINEHITIDGTKFAIIGVVEDISGASPFAQNISYAPRNTIHRLFAPAEEMNDVGYMLIEFEQGTNSTSFEQRLKYELNRIKGIDEDEGDAFLIVSRQQFLEIFDTILLGIQAFVSAIAGISLVVGGIGIMNIMLVTVKERTKEIGLRKAVGAKNSSVLIQFLIESIALTTLGGLIGIAAGLGLSYLSVFAANTLQPGWGIQFVFVPSSIALACGVAITTGIIFGLYPAIKASRLHPIESLRYE